MCPAQNFANVSPGAGSGVVAGGGVVGSVGVVGVVGSVGGGVVEGGWAQDATTRDSPTRQLINSQTILFFISPPT